MREKDFSDIETRNNICINLFCYENGLVFPIFVSDQKFENSLDLFLVTDGDKSHYIYKKDFDRFMFNKTKNKKKKYFCKSCLQFFSSKNVLTKHEKDCLSINGAQSVKLENRTTEFENYFKQIPVPLKIYADFESNLEGVEIMKILTQKNIKVTFRVVLLTRLFVLIMDLVSPLPFLKAKMLLVNLLKGFLKSMNTVKN